MGKMPQRAVPLKHSVLDAAVHLDLLLRASTAGCAVLALRLLQLLPNSPHDSRDPGDEGGYHGSCVKYCRTARLRF
jgi:hypothetical protein